MTASDTAKKVFNELRRRAFSYFYVKRDVNDQLRSLSPDSQWITSVLHSRPARSRTYAIVVYFELRDEVSSSVQRLVRALAAQDVNVVIVCNHDMRPAQTAFFSDHAHQVILRANQGFDFGAYKDAIAHLLSLNIELDRLLMLNDSVFFARNGLDAFITAMLGDEDVIAAHEDCAEDHNLQSFALSLSRRIVESDTFRNFWRAYLPVNNRIYAIEFGEKALSRTILHVAASSRVIFSTARLGPAITAAPGMVENWLTVLPRPWRHDLEAGVRAGAADAAILNRVLHLVNRTSTIHSGAYLFPRFLNSPLLKKDLVYRDRFDLWEIESWIHEILPPAERDEYLTILRRKGRASNLDAADRRRHRVGVR